MHRQICELNESPVMLKLNPAVRTSEKVCFRIEFETAKVERNRRFFYLEINFYFAPLNINCMENEPSLIRSKVTHSPPMFNLGLFPSRYTPAISRSIQLPLEVYESVIDMVRGEACLQFVALTWTLATEEAERIGVDHVARISAANTGAESAGLLHSLFNLIFRRFECLYFLIIFLSVH